MITMKAKPFEYRYKNRIYTVTKNKYNSDINYINEHLLFNNILIKYYRYLFFIGLIAIILSIIFSKFITLLLLLLANSFILYNKNATEEYAEIIIDNYYLTQLQTTDEHLITSKRRGNIFK